MNKSIVTLLTAGLLGLAANAYAHHSFPAHYFADRMITIEGELTEYLFRNPHSFIHMAVTWYQPGAANNSALERAAQ